MRMIRTYNDLIQLKTFEERYEYLRVFGKVGEETFGFDRIFNQMFYRSKDWHLIRDKVIARDFGRDLAVEGREIPEGVSIIIHHMNPIKISDIRNNTDFLLNPNYLITTTDRTHKAIHYGDKGLLMLDPVVRYKNDTCPWKH